MQDTKRIPLDFEFMAEATMLERAEANAKALHRRRSVRDFSAKEIDPRVIAACLDAAGSAPSGANKQPWHFAVVRNQKIKSRIRLAAEEEEREFYNGRAPQAWLDDLAPLDTNADKPFLEIAPALIVIFAQKYHIGSDGRKAKHYYTTESVGIASGMLIAALHNAGLATLTHTPSPMKFLNSILDRPQSEKPLMIVVCGYPAEGATVPSINRKSLAENCSFHD
ncbi:MAG: oxidoreductase [Pseudohongiella sp.]|nr:MAG: oxidoreductase [Pseudohongiella sp.]